MSCMGSASSPGKSPPKQHPSEARNAKRPLESSALTQKLAEFSSKHKVRFPTIIRNDGNIVSHAEKLENYPAEFVGFTMTFDRLARKIFALFSSSSSKRIKIKGCKQSLFCIYPVDNSNCLVFYVDYESDSKFVVSCKDLDLDVLTFVASLKPLLSTITVDVV